MEKNLEISEDHATIVKRNLHTTMRNQVKEKRFQCKECKETFTRCWDLIRHVRSHSEVKNKTPEKKLPKLTVVMGMKLYRCNECRKVFPQRFHLKRHLSVRSKGTQ